MTLLIVIACMAFAVSAIVNHDRIVARMYSNHKEHWVRADRPWGIFWRPADAGVFGLGQLSGATFMPIRTPAWAEYDDELVSRFRRLRLSAFAALACFFAGLLAMVFQL